MHKPPFEGQGGCEKEATCVLNWTYYYDGVGQGFQSRIVCATCALDWLNCADMAGVSVKVTPHWGGEKCVGKARQ